MYICVCIIYIYVCVYIYISIYMHVCLHVHLHVDMLGCVCHVVCPVMHTNESITRDGETRPVMTQPLLNNPTLRTIYICSYLLYVSIRTHMHTHAYQPCADTPCATSQRWNKKKQVCDAQQKLPFVGVKVPQFSFKRLPGADPSLGVEMSSTGEVCVVSCMCVFPDYCVSYVCMYVCMYVSKYTVRYENHSYRYL